MVRRRTDIRVKRVYDPPDPTDGTRILVDRLWPRGLRKDSAALALWLKEIAPSSELRQWFSHDSARWQEFTHRYRVELSANKAAIGKMRDLLKLGPLTLLYSARDVEHNHAIVLADYLRNHGKET